MLHRRSIIIVLIGITATLVGLTTFDYLRRKSCVELGGTWQAVSRQCALATGETVGTGTPLLLLAGLLVGAAVGFTLFRVLLFVTGHARRMMER